MAIGPLHGLRMGLTSSSADIRLTGERIVILSLMLNYKRNPYEKIYSIGLRGCRFCPYG